MIKSSTVEAYLERKAKIFIPPQQRDTCLLCRKPKVSCYCESLRTVKTDPRFLILMHSLEARHPVGTGRMAHRCLANSILWVDSYFSPSKNLENLLQNNKISPVLLFPGPTSLNLSQISPTERLNIFSEGKEAVVIVLDATWEIAKKMLHHTPSLQKIPRMSFSARKESGFLVRKQPHPQCLSTIEAIHETLRLLNEGENHGAPHDFDFLLEVFDEMVQKQLQFRVRSAEEGPSRHNSGYLARKARRLRWRELKARLKSRAATAEKSPAIF